MNSLTGKYLKSIVFILIFSPLYGFGQGEPDSNSTEALRQVEAEDLVSRDSGRTVDPGKAALYSALVPGLGQIYNRKYWKLPIVYVALGTATYAAIWNNQQANIYLDAFYEQTDPGNPNPGFAGVYTEAQLIELYYQHRRWQDMSIIIGAALYGLQVLDAYVDAHLYDFDVSDDLTLHWEPSLINMSYQAIPALGVGLTLSFK